MDERIERPHHVLFVDDEPNVLDGLRRTLRSHRPEWILHFAGGVDEALALLAKEPIDAVVTDVNMPLRDGFDLLASIRADAELESIPVVIVTGNGEANLKRKALDLGATDLLAKPVEGEDLVARVHSVLRIKAYHDQLERHARELERRVLERTAQLEAAQIELIWRLGKAGEFRDSDTGYHVVRVGFYVRQLGVELGLDHDFTRSAFLTSPLHDIGKIGIPDDILLKPGKLTEEEWVTMRTHSSIDGRILRDDVVAKEYVEALGLPAGPSFLHNPLLEMAAEIAEYHHEKWDGSGYPFGCKGEEIPLAARLTAVADVYDALGSRRPYKQAFPREKVMDIMTNGRGTHFDPDVFDAFLRSVDEFERIRDVFDDTREDPPQADVTQSLKELGDAA